MTDFATTVYGGAGGDLMTGTEENNLIFANQGNDTVNSGAGDDFVYGWTGDDVIRGEAGNDTLSGEDGNDVLVGGSGGDQFFGGIGDDTIIGGLGYDIMNAGEGADVFRFETLADSSTSQRDFIVNYEAGVDKIDLSGLGFDAISTSAGAPQGTLVASFEASLNRTHITDEYSDFSFSIDGNYANTLSNTDFIFESDTTDGGDGVDFIYTPILGQSNANSLHYLQGDNESGASVLSEQLSSLSGVNVVSQTYNASGGLIYLGMGGSSVDGNLATVEADRIWWYPDSNEAGAALIRAVAFMKRQLEDLVDEGVVKTALTWWQGENSGWEVGFNADPANAAERYRQATSDIFDYIQAELGLIEGVGDIDFYLIQTPFFDVDAATNGGLSQANQTTLAQGLTLVREQQELLADLRDDVHYAVTIDDLPTAEDSGDPESATDQWHLDDNSYEVIGARLASFIADDLGYTTDAAQLLQGTQEAELLVGGVGDDTLIGDDGNDSLEGAEGEDEIFGGMRNGVMTLCMAVLVTIWLMDIQVMTKSMAMMEMTVFMAPVEMTRSLEKMETIYYQAIMVMIFLMAVQGGMCLLEETGRISLYFQMLLIASMTHQLVKTHKIELQDSK